MVVITSIFIAEANTPEPLTFEQLEKASAKDRVEDSRELISMYEGKNRVLPIE